MPGYADGILETKLVSVFAGNHEVGLPKPPGDDRALRRQDRQAARAHGRDRDHGRADGCRVGGRHARARPAGRARAGRSRRRCAGALARRRRATRVREFAEVRVASRNAEHAAGARRRGRRDGVRPRSKRPSPARTSSAPAPMRGSRSSRREWLEPGMHVTSVGASRDGPELDPEVMGRGLLAVESRVAFEPYPAGRARAPGARPECRRRARRDPRRNARGPLLSGADHRLQVDGARSRGCGRGRARLPTSARGWRRHRGRAVIALAEIEAARERLAGVDRPHAARPARARRGAGGDLSQAREPSADRLLQAARRGERAPARLSGRARARRLDGERGQHGAGRRLVGAQARRALHGRPSRTRLRRPRSPRSGGWAQT